MRKFYIVLAVISISISQSCLKNPDVDIQNQKIRDLQDRDSYLIDRIKYQEARLDELEIELKEIKKAPLKKQVSTIIKKKVNADTLCVKVFHVDTLN